MFSELFYEAFEKPRLDELSGETFAEKADNIWKILRSLKPEDCEMHTDVFSLIENRFGVGIARRKVFSPRPSETFQLVVFSDYSTAIVTDDSPTSLNGINDVDEMLKIYEVDEDMSSEIKAYLSMLARDE